MDNLRDSMAGDSKLTANDLRTFYEQMLKFNQFNEQTPQFDPNQQINRLNVGEQFNAKANRLSNSIGSDQFGQELLSDQLIGLNQPAFKGQKSVKSDKSQKTSSKTATESPANDCAPATSWSS